MGAATWMLANVIYQTFSIPSNEFTWRCLMISLCCTEPCPGHKHNHPIKALVMGTTSDDETKTQGNRNRNRNHVSPLLGLHLLKYLTA